MRAYDGLRIAANLYFIVDYDILIDASEWSILEGVGCERGIVCDTPRTFRLSLAVN